MSQVLIPEERVRQAFLAATPAISEGILDFSIKHPIFMADQFQVKPWPHGAGNVLQELAFVGGMPDVERGFSKWAKIGDDTGCAPCEGDNCSYNWTTFAGHGFSRKTVSLMKRDFRSPRYCVGEIQSTDSFMEVFAKIMENLYAQRMFFMEYNVGQNFLTGIAKKYVVDSDGFKYNPNNIYVYRPPGDKRVSMLTMGMLEEMYEWLRRTPSAVPYGSIDGAPFYALQCSSQLLSRLYRDDPAIRQDMRFANPDALIKKYNFLNSIRGLYIPAPILYPRRFEVQNGNWFEVLPFLNNVPMEVGAGTTNNPRYMLATHEEVLVHGMRPFSIWSQQNARTIGSGTSFGPEYDFMANWGWINIQTEQDVFQREGYFASTVRMGLSQQWSDGVYGIIVERPKQTGIAAWLPDNACPPTAIVCDNSVPDVTGPCGGISGWSANPMTAGHYYIYLDVPTTAVATNTVDFGLDTGGYITGTVVAVSTDKKTLEVTFAGGITPGLCDHFTTLFCDDTRGCYASVLRYDANCADNTRVDLTLEFPIKANAGDTVTVFYGDGTQADVTLQAVNWQTDVVTIDVGGTPYCDQVNGVLALCVPTATEATCPGCAAAALVVAPDSSGGVHA